MSTSDRSPVPYKSVLLFLGGALAAYSAFCAHQAYIAEKPVHDRGLRRSNALTRRGRRERQHAELPREYGDNSQHASSGVAALLGAQFENTSARIPESSASSQGTHEDGIGNEAHGNRGSGSDALALLEQEDMRAALGPDSRLMGVIYQIAENDSRQSAIVHRSVQCDSCSMSPITGIRYRCTTCADYDLCEGCEAQEGVHPRTHLFLKIRIPATKLGNVARQHAEVSVYPGKYSKFIHGQPEDLIQDIMTTTRSNRPLVDSWWDSYRAMAGTPYPEGGLYIPYAIGYKDLCHAVSPDEPLRNSLSKIVYERQFAAFDENQDGLIDFREYCMAKLNVADTADSHQKWQFVFRAYDFDHDGCIDRQDCLVLLQALVEATKELTRDVYLRPSGGAFDLEFLDTALIGSQPISAIFNGDYDAGVFERGGEGKEIMPTGENVVTDGRLPYDFDDSKLSDSISTTADRWELRFFGNLKPTDWSDDFLDQVKNDLYWPPYGVEERDLFGVNGESSKDQGSPNKLDTIQDNAIRSHICVAAFSRLQKEHANNNYKEQEHQRRQIRTLAGASEYYRLLSLQQPRDAKGKESLKTQESAAAKMLSEPNDLTTTKIYESAYLTSMLSVSLRELLDPLFAPYEQLSAYAGADWLEQGDEKIDLEPIWTSAEEKQLIRESVADLAELIQSGAFESVADNAGLVGLSFCRSESTIGTQLYETYIERRYNMGLISEEDYNTLRIRHNDARKERESKEKSKADSRREEEMKEPLKVAEIAEAIVQVSEQENWNASRVPAIETIGEMSLEGLLAASGYMKSGEEEEISAGTETELGKSDEVDDDKSKPSLDSAEASEEQSSPQVAEAAEEEMPSSEKAHTGRPLMVEILMRNDVQELFTVKARLMGKVIAQLDENRGGPGRLTVEQFTRMVALVDDAKQLILSSWQQFSVI